MTEQFTNEEKSKFDKCTSFEEFTTFLEDYSINKMDNYGNSILHYYLKSLSYKSNKDRYKNNQPFKLEPKPMIDAMIKKGFDVNVQSTQGAKKNTVLSLCIGLGYKSKEIFDLLIEHGADVNQKVKQGNSLLFETIMVYTRDKDTNGYIMKRLIELGADRHAENNMKVSAISMATKIGSKEILDFFEEKE